jgi:hypothetical protein
MVPVFLNHVCVVVEPETCEAMRQSPEIAALASSGDKTAGTAQGRWTGFYITGRQTAIEIIAAGPNLEGGRWRVGQSGIGLGVNPGDGGLAGPEKSLRASFGDRIRIETDTRKNKDSIVALFTAIHVEGEDSDVLSTWFTELSPGFMVLSYPGAAHRHAVGHSECAAATFLPDHLLDDVVGLTVALSPPESSVLIAELRIAGWMRSELDGKIVMNGPDAAITIVPVGLRAGIRDVELRLRHLTPRKETLLGSARLLLDGETGRLGFWTVN